MQVQTYEVEQTEASEIQRLANEGEHAELITKLGLDGQQKLISNESATPFPYRVMTKEEEKVFRILFPNMTTLEKYSSDLIPLRVLQVAAYVKDTNFCDKGLHVWHPEEAINDPILVGYTKIPDSTWGERIYLLARWGSALLPFEKLRDKAKALWIAERKAKIAKAEQTFNLIKTTAASDAELYFQNKSIETSVYF